MRPTWSQRTLYPYFQPVFQVSVFQVCNFTNRANSVMCYIFNQTLAGYLGLDERLGQPGDTCATLLGPDLSLTRGLSTLND